MRDTQKLFHLPVVITGHAKCGAAVNRRIRRQEPKHTLFAVNGRYEGYSHVHLPAIQCDFEVTVLRFPFLGNIHFRQNLGARHNALMNGRRKRHVWNQHSVAPHADNRLIFVGLDMNITGVCIVALQKQAV